MSEVKKTAVVILNWNGIGFLKKFIAGVSKYTIDENTALYIADNGSSDGSVEYIRENFPEIQLVVFDKNYGFTGGYNKALKQIEAEYYVLLNSDVEVSENWVKEPVRLLDKNKNVAVVMPKILSYSEKNKFEYAGAAGGFIDKYGYPFCRGRIISEVEQDRDQYNFTDEIFWASGAAFFVRADLYHQEGGLDKDFFAHMEEIDLCWRFKNLGYKILYTSKSVVYHVGGGALPNDNPQKIYLNYRNNLYLLLKNLSANKLFLTIFIRLILDGLAAFVYLAQRKFSFFFAVLRAHYSFYSNLSKIARKRSKNNRPKHFGVYQKSIVISFFINKKRNFKSLNF